MRTAIGFSVHTGWAALVVATRSEVRHRARVELIEGPTRFVFHAARELKPARARDFVQEQREAAAAAVTRAIVLLGFELDVAAMIVPERRLDLPLEKILASHPLLHTAEGWLYRHAVAAACEGNGIPVRGVTAARAAAMAPRVEALGEKVGRPWARDQRDATAACLAVLTSGPAGA